MLKIKYFFHSSIGTGDKEEIKKYLGKKLERWNKFFKKHTFPPKLDIEMRFIPKKKRYRLNIQLESAIGKFIGTSEQHTITETIDEVLKDLRIQFRRNKSKIVTLTRRGGKSIKKRFSIDRSSRFRLPEDVR